MLAGSIVVEVSPFSVGRPKTLGGSGLVLMIGGMKNRRMRAYISRFVTTQPKPGPRTQKRNTTPNLTSPAIPATVPVLVILGPGILWGWLAVLQTAPKMSENRACAPTPSAARLLLRGKFGGQHREGRHWPPLNTCARCHIRDMRKPLRISKHRMP